MYLPKGHYTIRFQAGHSLPETFLLKNGAGEIYYLRQNLSSEIKDGCINFNIAASDNYTANAMFSVRNFNKNLRNDGASIELPVPERIGLAKPFKVRVNNKMGATPARIFTVPGVIEVSDRFMKMPVPLKTFILLHELGHFYYKTEWKCDLFALKNFLQLGFNESNAYYALANILKYSDENDERVKRLYNSIKR